MNRVDLLLFPIYLLAAWNPLAQPFLYSNAQGYINTAAYRTVWGVAERGLRVVMTLVSGAIIFLPKGSETTKTRRVAWVAGGLALLSTTASNLFWMVPPSRFTAITSLVGPSLFYRDGLTVMLVASLGESQRAREVRWLRYAGLADLVGGLVSMGLANMDPKPWMAGLDVLFDGVAIPGLFIAALYATQALARESPLAAEVYDNDSDSCHRRPRGAPRNREHDDEDVMYEDNVGGNDLDESETRASADVVLNRLRWSMIALRVLLITGLEYFLGGLELYLTSKETQNHTVFRGNIRLQFASIQTLKGATLLLQSVLQSRISRAAFATCAQWFLGGMSVACIVFAVTATCVDAIAQHVYWLLFVAHPLLAMAREFAFWYLLRCDYFLTRSGSGSADKTLRTLYWLDLAEGLLGFVLRAGSFNAFKTLHGVRVAIIMSVGGMGGIFAAQALTGGAAVARGRKGLMVELGVLSQSVSAGKDLTRRRGIAVNCKGKFAGQ